jgi:hypothetical protein
MVIAIIALIVILALLGLGFAVKALLWLGLVLLVIWVVGWFMGVADGTDSRRRWYYW